MLKLQVISYPKTRGSKSPRKYNGCFGNPCIVTSKQWGTHTFVNNPRTASPRPISFPCVPHPATTRSAPFANRAICRSFSSPIGSSTSFKPLGSVDRNAKMFTTSIAENPQRTAYRWHRVSVGSSTSASAVDGLSKQKHTRLPPDSQRLPSVYRYRSHSENFAHPFILPVTASPLTAWQVRQDRSPRCCTPSGCHQALRAIRSGSSSCEHHHPSPQQCCRECERSPLP